MDKAISYGHKETSSVEFPKLHLHSVELRVYCVSRFANNNDLSWKLGCVNCLVDLDWKCSIVHWSSRKTKRVTRSTMTAELFALLHGFDIGVALQDLVSEILGRKIVM
jgi:hypothetical protein